MKKKTDANKKSLPQPKLPKETPKGSKLSKESPLDKVVAKTLNESAARNKESKLVADKPKPVEEEKKKSENLPDLREAFRKRPQY